tara:strand:- start:299 stop:424 length:126 start_codon:yes stop_codon:yes gene_type:complete
MKDIIEIDTWENANVLIDERSDEVLILSLLSHLSQRQSVGR